MRFFLAALALLPLTSRAAPQDLLGTARAAGTFNTLLAALEVAELDRALRPPASFTVFAPTDEAFAALPEGTVEALLEPANREVLIDLLSSHFLPGRLSAADLLQARQVTTSSGREVEIKLNGGSVFIGGARLRDADIQTENGLVHSIDSVILPQVPELNPVEKVAALAIEKGVPLFNAGQPEACAAIYEVAVEAILQLGAEDLPQSVLENARERLEASRHDEDATSRAWTLRPALDAFFTSASGAGDERTLISFDPGEAASKWFTLNDDVMGGISQSQFKVTGDRTGLFTGAISLENNGGFASIRSPDLELGLEGYRGVRFRVRGDGRNYSLTLRVGANGNPRRLVRGWRTYFDTVDGEWIQIEVPFEDFVRSAMGRSYPEAGPPDLSAVRSMSLLIADKNTDPFELEFDDFRAYR